MIQPIRQRAEPDRLYRAMLTDELLRQAAQRDPLAPIHVLDGVKEGLSPKHQKQQEHS